MGIKANFRLPYQKALVGVCHFSALMFAMESHGFASWVPFCSTKHARRKLRRKDILMFLLK